MFVIEKFISDHRANVEQYEKAREKWVKENDYRHKSDYPKRHPSDKYHIAVKSTIITFTLVGVCLLLIGFFKKNHDNNKNKPPKQATQTETKNCRDFNINDKVRIQYGRFVGNVGTVVGGCEQGQNYQIKIDEGSMANPEDGNANPVGVGGWVIDVNKGANLVKIEMDKEK